MISVSYRRTDGSHYGGAVARHLVEATYLAALGLAREEIGQVVVTDYDCPVPFERVYTHIDPEDPRRPRYTEKKLTPKDRCHYCRELGYFDVYNVSEPRDDGTYNKLARVLCDGCGAEYGVGDR